MAILRSKYLCFVSAVTMLPHAAGAADLYRPSTPPPAYAAPATLVVPSAWAGFYGGINGGYGWNAGSGAIDYLSGPAAGDTTSRAAPQGGFGGGQIGYNFQKGGFVFGLETDFQGSGIGDRTSGTSSLGYPFASKEDIDWFGTVRGRVGFAAGNTLFYGTGGFAYGDVRERAFDNGTAGSNTTQTGWVAGGGIEYKINPSWSLKGEYQYIDLGSEKLQSGATAPAAETNNLDTSLHTIRLGLNYRFGGGSEPLK